MPITLHPAVRAKFEKAGKLKPLKKTGATQLGISATSPSKPKQTKFRKKKKVVTRPKEKPEVLSTQQLKTKVAKLERLSNEKLDVIVRTANQAGNSAFGSRKTGMSQESLDAAIEVCASKYGIVLDTNFGAFRTTPRISKANLFALCASVGQNKTYAGRNHALRRLSKLGFRVSLTDAGPNPRELAWQ